jgi:hypothetical protein
MHLVCPTNRAYITVVATRKKFEALMNDHIMHNEVGQAIQRNAKANASNKVILVLQTQHNAQPTRYGENEKESIVLFKSMAFRFVVIFMQVPQKSMHHIFVGAPSNAFHNKEDNNGDNSTYPEITHNRVLKNKKNKT